MNDLISRQDAIDALKDLPTWWADEGGYYGGAKPPMEALLDPEDAISAIENLPSAQPEPCEKYWKPNTAIPYDHMCENTCENKCDFARKSNANAQQWIPCSERLPEDNEPYEVLCCDIRGNQLIAHPFISDEANTGFCAESEECYLYDCIAWMPLPEPYREKTASQARRKMLGRGIKHEQIQNRMHPSER